MSHIAPLSQRIYEKFFACLKKAIKLRMNREWQKARILGKVWGLQTSSQGTLSEKRPGDVIGAAAKVMLPQSLSGRRGRRIRGGRVSVS